MPQGLEGSSAGVCPTWEGARLWYHSVASPWHSAERMWWHTRSCHETHWLGLQGVPEPGRSSMAAGTTAAWGVGRWMTCSPAGRTPGESRKGKKYQGLWGGGWLGGATLYHPWGKCTSWLHYRKQRIPCSSPAGRRRPKQWRGMESGNLSRRQVNPTQPPSPSQLHSYNRNKALEPEGQANNSQDLHSGWRNHLGQASLIILLLCHHHASRKKKKGSCASASLLRRARGPKCWPDLCQHTRNSAAFMG